MIDSYAKAYALLEVDPDVDPAVFWPLVGITKATIYEVGLRLAKIYNVPFPAAMALMETGATLARPETKGLPTERKVVKENRG